MYTLRRFSFGPTETELDAALAMGLDSWLEEQLAADASDAPDVESRLAENGGGGTDHGHGGVMFVMGGGILGGKVYGEWPGLAPDNLYGPGDLAITTDFREVLAEIVQKRLGNDRIDEIFPGYRARGFLGLATPRSS